METIIRSSFTKLRHYCEKENFKGWDPYDGLNSRLFNSLPLLKRSAICRLIMIQLFKRSPVNLRRLFMVPKGHNAKGVALFLSGYCNLYNAIDETNDLEISKEECLDKINYLSELLISLGSEGYSGACWGYNFDWQARRLFLFPRNTPTVVATCFAVEALFKSYDITRNESYKSIALSSADFILCDLNRSEQKRGFLFSYSPLNGNNTVYNASLLGSKALALCAHYSGNENYFNIAKESIIACIDAQNSDGSWRYGALDIQNWIDSFHTGYNLEALAIYQQCSGDSSFSNNINMGLKFYLDNFFESDGVPKYYNNKTYPVDIHCPGQLIVTLNTLNISHNSDDLIKKVLFWTIKNMQSKKGYFYYQLKKGISTKIPYMRWSQAFMFNALTNYIK